MSNAISGTRRAMKELVDGTIRVQIDIDPTQRAAIHRLFGEIDMPVALAPLTLGVTNFGQKQEAPAKEKLGPLGMLAAQWCERADFAAWFFTETGERFSVQAFKDYLSIDTRKHLDTNEQAKNRFQTLIRKPFIDYLETRHD